MKTFYVSLTRDLLGCYLAFQADSERAVRLWLEREYLSPQGVWKLPWCAVYSKVTESGAIVLKAKCGPLYEGDFFGGAQ